MRNIFLVSSFLFGLTFLICSGVIKADLGDPYVETTVEIEPERTNVAYPKSDEDRSTKHELEICQAQNSELLARLERIESVFNISHLNPDLEDSSVIEVMFRTVQEKLFTSVPPTDEECSFNLMTGKCNPSCRCAFQPKLGDYTLSRACRLKPTAIDSSLAPEDQCEKSQDEREVPWMETLMKAAFKAAQKTAVAVHRKLDKVAPPTDPECTFSLKNMKCVPEDLCTFDFQWGDFHPGRSCRYKLDELLDD